MLYNQNFDDIIKKYNGDNYNSDSYNVALIIT